jgi:exonuclease SbcD
VGCASADPADEVIVLKGANGEPRLIVCAVPYLRDRDIRTSEAGESVEDKDRKIIEGIRSHYRTVCEAAEQRRALLGIPVPIIATGHLFVSGGRTVDGDGVRELYVGSLAQVREDIFPESIDYLALGHLHVPQKVGGSDFVRYAGSPLPVGFGEAMEEKSVVILDFSNSCVTVATFPVPVFQELKSIRGDWKAICCAIDAVRFSGNKVWLEIIYEGNEIIGNLSERLNEITWGTALEILRVKNSRVMERALSAMDTGETLDDLDVMDVFTRCLETKEVPEDQRPALLSAYREILVSLSEIDQAAE